MSVGALVLPTGGATRPVDLRAALAAWVAGPRRAAAPVVDGARHVPDSDVGDDAADVLATLGGDGEAFERLVRRHQAAVARHLHRFTRQPGQLEQLVQDTFVEAWRSLRGWRADAPLEFWLRSIATRAVYRSWKHQARHGPVLELVDDLPASDEPGDGARDAAATVHRWLARLAPRDRLVLTLLHLQERSVSEIAELTGWSRALVKVQAHRARKRLRALIESTERPR